MAGPVVSICVPTYNGAKYLKSCLDSCISQTFKDVEIILVDDCSTDDTFLIAKEFSDKYSFVKACRNEKNLGLVGNWNRCIELAKGDWIKFVFQDDYLDLQCLEKMIQSASHEKSLIVCNRSYILEKGLSENLKQLYRIAPESLAKILDIREGTLYISPGTVSTVTAKNISLNFIGEPSVVMFHRTRMKEFGIFDAGFNQICDLEFNLRIATVYGLTYLHEVLVHVRVHGSSASSDNQERKLFALRFLEPVRMAYALLYGSYYGKFRKQISFLNRFRVRLYLSVRLLEAQEASLKSIENTARFEEFIDTYPDVIAQLKDSFSIRIALLLVKIRRSLANVFISRELIRNFD